MQLALDSFADNPVIDELVEWPPRKRRIVRIRACNVLFRRPFIEVTLADGEVFQRHFLRQSFAQDWAEARVILQTLTAIELITEFRLAPLADRVARVEKILAVRDECIRESDKMFEQGMYAQFLQQYGEDCKDLPTAAAEKIAVAQQQLRTGA